MAWEILQQKQIKVQVVCKKLQCVQPTNRYVVRVGHGHVVDGILAETKAEMLSRWRVRICFR